MFLYLLAWLFLPRYDGQVRLERAVRGGEASSIVLLVIALLAIVPDLFGHWRMGPWPLIGLAILAVVGLQEGLVGPAPLRPRRQPVAPGHHAAHHSSHHSSEHAAVWGPPGRAAGLNRA